MPNPVSLYIYKRTGKKIPTSSLLLFLLMATLTQVALYRILFPHSAVLPGSLATPTYRPGEHQMGEVEHPTIPTLFSPHTEETLSLPTTSIGPDWVDYCVDAVYATCVMDQHRGCSQQLKDCLHPPIPTPPTKGKIHAETRPAHH